MRITALSLLLWLALTMCANAAEWPSNWLGPQDPQYAALNIGVYYFGAVLHDFPAEDGSPSLPGNAADWLATMAALPELAPAEQAAEFERVKAELDLAAEFMWRNSRFNFAVDYTYIADFEPRLRSSIAGADAPYFSPVDFSYYGDARDKYDGLLQIMVLYRYDEQSGQLERIKGGGGFTWGCDGQTGQCGWSWWAACTADNVCGSDWLVVHEFGHQMDSLFDQSGHPEFWFNHLAPAEGNTERFGEHFDANSYIMRRVPEADWLDLKWGTVRTFADVDGDGVPGCDDWLNSRGYLTDPDDACADADADGMTDFAELMAANGNRNGHGERLHPSIGYCDPLNPDSDGDDLLDAEDPMPMQDLLPYIFQHPSSIFSRSSGAVQETQSWPSATSIVLTYQRAAYEEEPQVEPALFVTLGESFLGETGPDLEYKLMLDLDNNGWFYGSDNYQLEFTASGITEWTLHDASSHQKWPGAVPVEGTLGQVLLQAPSGALQLALPQSLLPEFSGKPGEMIGLNIGVRHPGEAWYYMLGEPNTLLQFELR